MVRRKLKRVDQEKAQPVIDIIISSLQDLRDLANEDIHERIIVDTLNYAYRMDQSLTGRRHNLILEIKPRTVGDVSYDPPTIKESGFEQIRKKSKGR